MYPAKVLLFGEHTVLRGGRGLAVPYTRRGLRWVRDRPDEALLAFCDYLRVAFADRGLLNTDALEDFLANDWRLAGDIPVGYGLGSSGAVCAAIWDRFATPRGKFLTGEDLRQALARMEQHFHGSSSGTDPLVCYLGRPVMLGEGAPRPATLPPDWNDRFFLVDTGTERKAARLIQNFTSRYDADAGFARAVDTHWREPADRAIAALLGGKPTEVTLQTSVISEFQHSELPDFIPPRFHGRWSGEHYVLKLCGAGGGGMLLGLRLGEDRNAVEQVFGRVEWL